MSDAATITPSYYSTRFRKPTKFFATIKRHESGLFPFQYKVIGGTTFQRRSQRPYVEEDGTSEGWLRLSRPGEQGSFRTLRYAQFSNVLKSVLKYRVRPIWGEVEKSPGVTERRVVRFEIVNLKASPCKLNKDGEKVFGEPYQYEREGDIPLSDFLVLLKASDLEKHGGRESDSLPSMSDLDPSLREYEHEEG